MHTSQGAVVSWLRHSVELSDSNLNDDLASDTTGSTSRVSRDNLVQPVVGNGHATGADNYFNHLPSNGINNWQQPPNEQQPLEPVYYPGQPNGPLGKEWALLSRVLVTNASTMGCCNKKKLLMVSTSVCACASFAFLCIAVATDYWLYALERIKENENTTIMHTHTGLWRKCVTYGEFNTNHETYYDQSLNYYDQLIFI